MFDDSCLVTRPVPVILMAEEVEVEVETVSSPSDGEEVIQVDDPFSMRRQELKDLRTQLLIHRKAAKSGDKKRKKAVQEEIAAIEALLESKRLALESDMKQVFYCQISFPHPLGGRSGSSHGTNKGKRVSSASQG